MKTRNRTTKLVTIVAVLGVLAAIWAIWGARPAEAIIIVNSKTGMFTLTQGEAVRLYVVNTGGEEGIIIINSIVFDSQGVLVAELPHQRVLAGHTGALMFEPRLMEGELLPVRIELMVSGESIRRGGLNFIPTLEVFDTATGKTNTFDGDIFDFNPQPEPPMPSAISSE